MNPRKINVSLILKVVVFVVCLASFLPVGKFKVGLAQSTVERKVNTRAFKNMPLAIKEVRNLQKKEDWFRDLEIEVKNVSDKPIYFISLIIEFPDIPAPPPTTREDGTTPSRSTTGFGLTYGSKRLMDVSQNAIPDDVSLKPGETYVFKIPDSRVKGLEHMKKEKNLSSEATNTINLEFDIISFGDGTGYIAGQKRLYAKQPKKVKRLSKRTGAIPAMRKAS